MNDAFEVDGYTLFSAKSSGQPLLREIRDNIDDLKQCVEKGLLLDKDQCFTCGEWLGRGQGHDSGCGFGNTCSPIEHVRFFTFRELMMGDTILCKLPMRSDGYKDRKKCATLAQSWLAKWDDFVKWVNDHIQVNLVRASIDTSKLTVAEEHLLKDLLKKTNNT